MMIRNSLAMAAAAALATAPTVAQAASAEPAPIQRAAADASGNELAGGLGGSSWLVPGLVLVAVIVGAFLIFDDDEDVPTSP